MKKLLMSKIINQNFYQNLRKNGRSHRYIMDLIKIERKAEFLKDIEELNKPKTFMEHLAKLIK